MDNKRCLLIRDAHGETIDELQLDDEEPFLLESFSNLIAAHDRVGRKLILARVEISSEGDNGGTTESKSGDSNPQKGIDGNVNVQKPHYYSAHQINKVIFRKAGKSWIFRLYARDPLTNLEILGDVKYFMVVPINHSFNETNPRPKSASPTSNNSVPPPLPQRVESFVPTCSKPLSSRRTSFERLMRSALGDDQKDLRIAELSGPRIPEFHENQRTGRSGSGSIPATTRPRSWSYLYHPQSRYAPHDTNGSISNSSHAIDSKTAEDNSEERSRHSDMNVSESILSMSLPARGRVGSDASLKITLHRKSIAEGIPHGKQTDQKPCNPLSLADSDIIKDPNICNSTQALKKKNSESVQDDIYRSATLSEGDCEEEDETLDDGCLIRAQSTNSHSSAPGDNVRSTSDTFHNLQPKTLPTSDPAFNERLNSTPPILEKEIGAISAVQYHAVFIGTDDNYLTKAQLRQLFEANALEQTDSELFTIPKELLEQEGIMLTEEDERDEAEEIIPMATATAVGQQPVVRTDPVLATATVRRIGERGPSTDFLSSMEYLDESADGLVELEGHAAVEDGLSRGEHGRRFHTSSPEGSRSGLSPLATGAWVRSKTRSHRCLECYQPIQRWCRNHKFSVILVAGFLVATLLKFVLPPERSLIAILTVLGISASSIIFILYRNKRRNAR